MNAPLNYRELAAEQRRQASTTTLMMVRLKHLAAAERLDHLAEEAEWVRRETTRAFIPQTIF